MNPQRKFPPFGRQVAAILADQTQLEKYSGCTPSRATIWLATGQDAWDWKNARPNHLIIVLPPDENPATFNWRFLRGHEPILLTGDDAKDVERRREIATAMFRDGVQRVLAGNLLIVSDTRAMAA